MKKEKGETMNNGESYMKAYRSMALGLHVELDPLKERRRTKRIRCANIWTQQISRIPNIRDLRCSVFISHFAHSMPGNCIGARVPM